jgi:hypothetical protein
MFSVKHNQPLFEGFKTYCFKQNLSSPQLPLIKLYPRPFPVSDCNIKIIERNVKNYFK